MTDIGVPGSPDGPPIEPEVVGEVVVTFLDSGKHSATWQRIPGRSQREVITEAVELLQGILEDDMLEKLDGEVPRVPPL